MFELWNLEPSLTRKFDEHMKVGSWDSFLCFLFLLKGWQTNTNELSATAFNLELLQALRTRTGPGPALLLSVGKSFLLLLLTLCTGPLPEIPLTSSLAG